MALNITFTQDEIAAPAVNDDKVYYFAGARGIKVGDVALADVGVPTLCLNLEEVQESAGTGGDIDKAAQFHFGISDGAVIICTYDNTLDPGPLAAARSKAISEIANAQALTGRRPDYFVDCDTFGHDGPKDTPTQAASAEAALVSRSVGQVKGCLGVINSRQATEATYKTYLGVNHKARTMPVFGDIVTSSGAPPAAVFATCQGLGRETFGDAGGFSNFICEGVSQIKPRILFDPTNPPSQFNSLEGDYGTFFAVTSDGAVHGYGAFLNPSNQATNKDTLPAHLVIKEDIERRVEVAVLSIYNRLGSAFRIGIANKSLRNLVTALEDEEKIATGGSIEIPLSEVNDRNVQASGQVEILGRVQDINVNIHLIDNEGA